MDSYLSENSTTRRRPIRALHRGNIAKELHPQSQALVCNLCNTLTGDNEAARELVGFLRQNPDLVFGVATRRPFKAANALLLALDVPTPDFFISSSGTRIHFGADLLSEDTSWTHHIQFKWEPEAIRDALAPLSWLSSQKAEGQAPDKISYQLSNGPRKPEQAITSLLRRHSLRARAVVSRGKTLDVLPIRASKGHALRYVSWRLGIPLERVVTAGDSGTDSDMLKGLTRGIVVANFSKELARLRRCEGVYFSSHAHAAGVLDGLRHYGLN